MQVLSRLSKKLIALIVAVSMCLLLTSTAFAATLAPSDGYAYFYFAANGLSVDEGFKDGYKINGGSINYIASNIIAHTERIDETLLKSGEVNTFTILTGNTTGVVDETISRSDAGTKCDEFSVTVSTLRLILPDGKIVSPSKILAYKPVDTTTALNAEGGYAVTEITDNARIGDDNLDYAYKIDIQFDLTDVTLSSVAKILPNIKNVSLEIGAEPNRRNIVWYSTSENDGEVQLAPKSAMTGDEFPADSAAKFSASASVTGLTGYTSYKATMTGLAENTEYVYRVGNDTDGWSDIYSFKTQGFDGSFSFLAVADPQLGQGNRFDDIQDEIDGWTTTLNKSQENFTQTAFLACLGDQVAKTFVDGQFDAFFSPKELKSFALAVVPGNHDVGANYTPHYNMPNVSNLGVQSTMGAGSGDYYFTYGDALFMTINSISTAYDEHVQFLENTIEANPNAKWKIVMMHYGIFGGTEQGDTTEAIVNLRNAMAPEFSRLGIDVVLNGHEHSYARSYMMNAFTPNTQSGGSSVTDPDPSEVLYMTLSSASGSDYVKPKTTDALPNIAKVVQEYIPNVSKVDITDSSFTINTYRTSDMAIVDTFTINRTAAPAVKSVSVFPKNNDVKVGTTAKFAATIYGYNNPSADVVWSVSGNESAATTISADGVLSVDVDETAQALTVTATSAGNSSKYAQVTVTLKSNAPLLEEDFQSAEEGQVISNDTKWNGWTIATGNQSNEDTEITVVNEKYPSENFSTDNMVAQFYRSRASDDDSKLYAMKKDFSVSKEDGLLSIKFRLLKPINDNAKVFTVVLNSEYDNNGTTSTATATFNFDLALSKFNSTGLTTGYFDGTTQHTSASNKWFDFEILSDLKNDFTYVYWDNKLISWGTAGGTTASKKIYGLKNLRFMSARNNGAIGGEAYVWLDDICVKTLTEEEAQGAYSQLTIIDSIENNDDITQVNLHNIVRLEDGAKLFVAVYNPQGSSMSKAVSVALNETQRATGEQTITLSEDILTNATGLLVKAFVWTGKLVPLASVLEKIQ